MGRQEVIDQQAQAISEGQKQAIVDGVGAAYDAGLADGGGQVPADTTPYSEEDVKAKVEEATQPLKDSIAAHEAEVASLRQKLADEDLDDAGREKLITDLQKSLTDIKASVSNLEAAIPTVVEPPQGGEGSGPSVPATET